VILGIDWTVQSELIEGRPTPNLYGLLFVTGLIVGYFVIKRMFKAERVPESYLDKLLIFVILATIIGARLGHVFFYGPYWDTVIDGRIVERGYLSHPGDILKVWEGGLASHGAAILILITLWWFSRRIVHRPFLWILDRIVAPIAIAGCCIRLGNLVNHEMVGTPTDLPWGFRFSNLENEPSMLVNGENVYRHPAQLYEAICYLLSFFVLLHMYWRTRAKAIPGRLFGAFMVLIWTARFVIEFIKVGQNQNDEEWFLKTGQLLSIPFILIGIYLLIRKVPQKERQRFTDALNTPLEPAVSKK
jgi:phosphatidylglycerol---prolipoprotein diacylglyceryl transferase